MYTVTLEVITVPYACSIISTRICNIKSVRSYRKSDRQQFIILSDSLSSLIARGRKKQSNQPYILEILEAYHKRITHGKIIIFASIPSHVGIRVNYEAHKLAKEATKIKIANIKIPYG